MSINDTELRQVCEGWVYQNSTEALYSYIYPVCVALNSTNVQGNTICLAANIFFGFSYLYFVFQMWRLKQFKFAACVVFLSILVVAVGNVLVSAQYMQVNTTLLTVIPLIGWLLLALYCGF